MKKIPNFTVPVTFFWKYYREDIIINYSLLIGDFPDRKSIGKKVTNCMIHFQVNMFST
jgi:hypothetical protein